MAGKMGQLTLVIPKPRDADRVAGGSPQILVRGHFRVYTFQGI